MFGKANLGDRVAQALVLIATLFALANGLFMLVDPLGWYNAVETVRFTGPPNQHFIRDIGLAYLMSGVLLGYGVLNLTGRWVAALAGAGWLLMHGMLHIWEVSAGICTPGIFWRDAPGVLGPPLLALGGIVLQLVRQRFAPGSLPKALFVPAIERLTRGEAAYIREIASCPGFMTEKFQHFMPLAMHRHTADATIYHMARIGATVAEDCGPCALIAADGALADGVPRELVNAALAARVPTGELADAFAFGQAIALNTGDVVALGTAIEAKHGRIVRTELALGAAAVRTYPALKRGLGMGKPCTMVPMQI